MGLQIPRLSEACMNSDLHGLRFACDVKLPAVRRLAWLLMFLVSLGGLAYLVSSRVAYYYSYPSMYNTQLEPNSAPAPAVLMCPKGTPSRLATSDPHVYIPSTEEWRNLSDTTVKYLLIDIFGMGILERSDTAGRLRMKKSFLISFHESDVREITLYNSSTVREWFARSSGDCGRNYQVVERVKALGTDVSLDPDAEYVSYVKDVGLKRGMVQCKFRSGGEKSDCTSDLKPVFTGAGGCLLFDNINGEEATFMNIQKKKNFIEFSAALPGCFNHGIDFAIFDPNDSFPMQQMHRFGRHSITMDSLFSKQNSPIKLGNNESAEYDLTRVYYREFLDKPYSTDSCSEVRQTTCVRDCLPRQTEYQMLTGGGYTEAEMNRCGRACATSCTRTLFTLVKVDEKSKSTIGNLHHGITFQITAQQFLLYEKYRQAPLYSAEALLTEIGGALGLFVGASVLTLYHMLEYSLLRVRESLASLTKHPRTRPHQQL